MRLRIERLIIKTLQLTLRSLIENINKILEKPGHLEEKLVSYLYQQLIFKSAFYQN